MAKHTTQHEVTVVVQMQILVDKALLLVLIGCRRAKGVLRAGYIRMIVLNGSNKPWGRTERTLVVHAGGNQGGVLRVGFNLLHAQLQQRNPQITDQPQSRVLEEVRAEMKAGEHRRFISSACEGSTENHIVFA